MACSHKHHCNGNTTMHYVCVVQLHVTFNYIKILRVAQQCFYTKWHCWHHQNVCRYSCTVPNAHGNNRIFICFSQLWPFLYSPFGSLSLGFAYLFINICMKKNVYAVMEDQQIDGRIVLKWNLQILGGKLWTGFI